MRSFTVLVVICLALYASAEDKDKDKEVHQTTIRVTPGILSKLLGSKPTSISLDGNNKQKKPTSAYLSNYPSLADYPEQYPEQNPQNPQQQNPNSNPYTIFPQKPYYPASRPYPQPYPVPVPVPYPQPQPLTPQIPPYPVYPGYPPMVYPGYPQFPVYPNYPPPIYPPPYPSKYPNYPGYPGYAGYPGYPGYPFLGDESGSKAPVPQNPDQLAEVVTNPELPGEPSDEDNNIDPYARQTINASLPEPLPSTVIIPTSIFQ